MTDRQAADTPSAELLNELIECTRDGERLFLDAAEGLHRDSGRAAP